LGLWGPEWLTAKWIFVAGGYVGVIIAAYRVWLHEHRKTEETADEKDERDQACAEQVTRLREFPAYIPWLLRLVRDGEGDASDHELQALHGLFPSLARYEGRRIYVNPIYRQRLRAWAESERAARRTAAAAVAVALPPSSG
jgi:hypothetical protein